MKKFAIEIKWGIIFTIIELVWVVFEKLMGWHDELIAMHATLTNFFAVLAILIYVLALLNKRKKFYNGKMTWSQGFISGLKIAIIIAILSPLSLYITTTVISTEYFPNAIEYAIESGKMNPEKAEKSFSLNNYIIQNVIGAVVMGMITSAIVALFVKKR